LKAVIPKIIKLLRTRSLNFEIREENSNNFYFDLSSPVTLQ